MDNKFVLSQSFNEIVFEKRNKKYGAYQIRRTYSRYALLAGIAAIFFFTCGTFTWAYVQNTEDVPHYMVRPIDVTDIKGYTEKETPKKEIPKQDNPVETKADKGPKTKVLTDKLDIVDDPNDTPPGDVIAKDPKGEIGATGPGNDLPPGNCLDCPPIDSTPVPIKIRDWTPFPPTCPELDNHITKNIRYPEMCRSEGIEGTVYVEFIVDTKGNYRDVKVVKGSNPALNREALRVMMCMPQWTPAKDEDGTLVDYIMRKPIRFSLNK
jgi:protein TonB